MTSLSEHLRDVKKQEFLKEGGIDEGLKLDLEGSDWV